MFKSFTTSQTKPTSYREEIVARKRLYRPYVTDGLKVYYDFANRASQQSGIARAYNLAGDDATAIHYNSPVYTPNGNLTYMDYDGASDYTKFTYDNSNQGDYITLELVMSFGKLFNPDNPALNYSGYLFSTNTNNRMFYNSLTGFGQSTGSGEIYGVSVAQLQAAGFTEDVTNFNHVTMIMGTNSSLCKMYINGVRQTESFVRGVLNGNYRDVSSINEISIGANTNGTVNGDIGVAEFKLYDRELSAREVAYNYGVAKSRKGV